MKKARPSEGLKRRIRKNRAFFLSMENPSPCSSTFRLPSCRNELLFRQKKSSHVQKGSTERPGHDANYTSNLHRFMEHTTPTVPSQFLFKVWIGWSLHSFFLSSSCFAISFHWHRKCWIVGHYEKIPHIINEFTENNEITPQITRSNTLFQRY